MSNDPRECAHVPCDVTFTPSWNHKNKMYSRQQYCTNTHRMAAYRRRLKLEEVEEERTVILKTFTGTSSIQDLLEWLDKRHGKLPSELKNG